MPTAFLGTVERRISGGRAAPLSQAALCERLARPLTDPCQRRRQGFSIVHLRKWWPGEVKQLASGYTIAEKQSQSPTGDLGVPHAQHNVWPLGPGTQPDLATCPSCPISRLEAEETGAWRSQGNSREQQGSG